jgi:hypothetical protein
MVNAPAVSLRDAPSSSAVVIDLVFEGDELAIIGPSVAAEGRTWCPVPEIGRDIVGFVVAQFIEDPPSLTTSTA